MKDTFQKEKLFRYIDRYNRAFNTGDWLIHKEAENDILNLIENLSTEIWEDGYSFGIYKVKEIIDGIMGNGKVAYNKELDVLNGEIAKLNPLCEGTAIGEECGKPKIEGSDFCQFHTDNLPTILQDRTRKNK